MKGMRLAEMNKMMSMRQGQGISHDTGINTQKKKTAIFLAKARSRGAKIPLKK